MFWFYHERNIDTKMKSGSSYFHIKDELEAFKSKYYVKFRDQQNEIPGIMLVPKLCLGTQLLLKLQLRKKDFEAGASGTSAFPSWSLGTRNARRENNIKLPGRLLNSKM